ncbi:hypothetical protein SAMN06295912_101261 [Sphingomonas laterariae]|uniref:Uncharacterized protein n=2 Tax=Edaphosphingomonas laterariae TaxID=861865 RepID=A0A239BNZ4_9SPHN|nr:hypothetical protein SAMN06295912_101261 [Sphingomonas laterariae]
MRFSRLLGMMMAGSMIATPVVAQAQVATGASSGASALSVANNPGIRSGAAVKNANKAGGAGWIIGAIAMVAGVTWAIVDDNDDDDDDAVSN